MNAVPNEWRRVAPAPAGWTRTARPGDPHKYFMVSTDAHANEPPDYLAAIEPEYRHRIPRQEVDEHGNTWLVTEGNRPQMVRSAPRPAGEGSGGAPRTQGYESRQDAEDARRDRAGREVAARRQDQIDDGIDVEIIYPNKGLLCWATPDPVFAMAMCRAHNRWSRAYFADHWDTMLPMAMIAAGDMPGAMAEITWAAEQGYKGLVFGNKPVYGPRVYGELAYNDPSFEPVWSLVEETGLPVHFHVSTGRDPRVAGGPGGAIVNYVCHSMETTMEPIVQMIASGVFERHPRLVAGTVESGIGWLPWLLETMDYAAKAHHFWVRPALPELPSTYFRRHCYATFQEDHAGLAAVREHDLVANVMWANDYPHHEGTWPHSATAIERTMGHLDDGERAAILGLNAARVYRLPLP